MTAETAGRDDFEECEDRSLYFTLSLYNTDKKVRAALGRPLDPETVRAFQPGYRGSKRLRDAVEPLFNDIADRERLGAVDDFLLDTLCPRAGEFLEFTAPDEIEWTTEGRRFIATRPRQDAVDPCAAVLVHARQRRHRLPLVLPLQLRSHAG